MTSQAFYREDELRQLLENRKILIAGYGREGRSTEALLKRLLPNVKPDIVEGNDALREAASKHYDLIIKSPGIPSLVLDGVCDMNTVSSQTDLFLQVYGDKTIGVTGTKGKSTTTNLIAHVLQYSAERSSEYNVVMAGNMGIPLFDVLEQLSEHSVIVCEFSCHQLENIHRAPHVGVLLNLYQEHLDHYSSYRDYQMAKMNIGLRQQSDDYFFYCSDNAELCERVEECSHSEKVSHCLPGHVEPYDLKSAQRWQDASRHLQGDHNLSNIEAASRVTALYGVAEADFRSALASFRGLEHRLELVGTFRGVTFYNDSISTIPAACEAAVAALRKVDTLILGGFDRGIDYTGLMHFLAKDPLGKAVRNIVFVGLAGRRMHGLQPLSGRNILLQDDYSRIVPWCYIHTQPGKICLLSPAAASYDAFKNFEERGRIFKDLVMHYQP